MAFCPLIGSYRWAVAVMKRIRVVAPFWKWVTAPNTWMLINQKTTTFPVSLTNV